MFNKSEGDINNLAIQMIEQDLIKALELFQYNVKENASFLSYVNYGVFLTEFASDILEYIEQPYKEAEHYLLSAQKQNPCFGAVVALGELYFKEEKYNMAVLCFKDASDFRETYSLHNNMAVAYYHLGQYDLAYIHFLRALFLCDNDNAEISYIYESFAFTAVLCEKWSEARGFFDFLKMQKDYDVNADSIAIAFLCKDYEYILNNFENLINDWALDYETMLILAQTFYVTKDKKRSNMFVEYLDNLEQTEYYEESIDKDTLFNTIENGYIINSVSFFPKHIFVCCFIGCKKHGSESNVFVDSW